jgi:diguanylate cyclase (GGDEF)-like protein
MGLANAAEPLVAVLLLRRGGRGLPDLTHKIGLRDFIVCAVLAGPAVGALIGSLGPALVAGDAILPRLPRWFVGDAVGVLVVAPALKLLTRHHLQRDVVPPLAVLTVVALAVVGPWEAPSEAGLPFLVLPALAFVALRLGPVGAALGVLLVAIVVEGTAVAGAGPFAHDGAFGGLIVVQMFLVMGSLTSLAVGMLAHDLVSRDELEATLREQALHDALTGLANRRLLFDRLDQANRRLARQPAVLAVLYLDLDRFKAVNDRYGHEAGDHVLRTTAERLLHTVRAQDTVARIGGDEFVVLAEGVDDDAELTSLITRLTEACETPITWRGQTLDVGASVGVASTRTPLPRAEHLLDAADHAMYAAKRGGARPGAPALTRPGA